MKTKIYLALVLVSLAFLTTACPCGDDGNDYMPLSDIELVNIDNSGENMFESDEPINKNAYVIGVYYLFDYNTYYGDRGKPKKFRIIERDYAKLILTNFSSTPQIFCLSDFAEGYPAGSDVTKFFKIGKSKNTDCNALFVLTSPPAKGEHSFKVVYECSDGLIIEQNTNPVTLF